MAKNIRVLLVDDHQVVREGLQHMLDGEDGIEVVCSAASAPDALNKATVFRPDIILTDIKMPGMDGVDFTRRIKERGLKCHVIMLTLFDEYLSLAMDAGASGYLLKDIKRQDLVEAIRKVHQGHVVIASNITSQRRSEYQRRANNASEDPKTPVGSNCSENLLAEVQLVLDAPSDAAQLMALINRVEETLDSTVHRLVGSWKGNTAITFPMATPTPLRVVMQKLQRIPEVQSVVEIPSSGRVDPSLARKTAALPKPPSECSKTVYIELATACPA